MLFEFNPMSCSVVDIKQSIPSSVTRCWNENSQYFPKVAQIVVTDIFSLRVISFKIAQHGTKYSGYFNTKICLKNYQKLSNLVTLIPSLAIHEKSNNLVFT